MRTADADTPTLPEDPAALRALLLEALGKVDVLSSRCDSVTAERNALVEQNERPSATRWSSRTSACATCC